MNILLLSFSLQSITAPDRWFAADKAKHFFMGSFVQSASFGVLTAAGVDKGPALAAASGMTLTITIGKEIRDRNGRGTPSVKDLAWGLSGAAAISPVLARAK